MMKKLIIASLLTILYTTLQAQPNSQPELTATKTPESIKIDGYLNEPAWSAPPDSATNFWSNFPADTTSAKNQTVVRFLFNDQYLYVSAVMRNTNPIDRYIASSLRRDFPFAENDAFGIIMDTYRDQTNGYGFYVSAYGVQREEQIFSGGSADGTWDTKWYSAVSYDSQSWTAEIAIPLKYLRFKNDVPEWNVNFVRNDVAANERSSWAKVPRNFSLITLAYHGILQWPDHTERVKKNVSLIPSITYTASQEGNGKVDTHARPSLDSKISITSALNLDITVNPDFSQAEVDQVQLNITRFELVFPEKRFFFIENSDLFSEFGVTQTGMATIHPFYSRRIGLQYNAKLAQYERTQLLGGLRLSGKINKNLRVGAMTVQTDKLNVRDENTGESTRFPGQNYSVLALQQKIFSRSNIGVILENRQGMRPDTLAKSGFNPNDFNRLVGLEYNLASADNSWTGKMFTNYSWTHNDKPQNAFGALLSHNTMRWSFTAGYSKADKKFDPDMGFVPRRNFSNYYATTDYRLYSKRPESKLNFIAPLVHYATYRDSLGRKTDHEWRYGFYITFKNTSYMYLLGWHEYTRLTAEFNPAQDDGPMLQPGTVYKYQAGSIYYETDFRKQRFAAFWLKAGQYFNGNFVQAIFNLNQKLQPWGTVGLNIDFNHIELPAPYSSNTIYAVGPKADISFSKSLFFNTIVQYNRQSENLNVYARMQWRFRPLSDLYIIYTNNHQTDPWVKRNQALTLKLVYWL